MFAVGKSGPNIFNATFNLFLLELGWPWVGKFVGFMIIFTPEYMFSNPTEFGISQTP